MLNANAAIVQRLCLNVKLPTLFFPNAQQKIRSALPYIYNKRDQMRLIRI
jgi:hypothetical protein